jgi:multiple sugar transport system substrate-binding protein
MPFKLHLSAWLLAAPASVLAAPAVELRHMLWDASQRPQYLQCARNFENLNPAIKVRISQQGWDDYWMTLATGFVAETAPDVFANHMAKFGEQVNNGVLVDIAPLVKRDAVDVGIYEAGLYENWARGTQQYALPADWDTSALVVNLDAAKQAGVTLAELRAMQWNPRDGGSFMQVAARLARDQAGRNALSPAFNRQQVLIYGYQNPGTGGMFGQTEWSHFAVSAGFQYQPAPWQGPLRYDDPVLADTIAWLAALPAKGISATPEAIGRIGADAMFASGRVAMVPTGSWMTGFFKRQTRFAYAYVPLPVGPSGQRASMRNGVAHSIWRGSKHPAQAWAWLRYLGSPACQQVVAQLGVVYPAVKGLAAVSADVQRRNGIEPAAFLEAADPQRGRTFAPPVVDHGAHINDLINGALEASLLGQVPPAQALREANAKANALLKR